MRIYSSIIVAAIIVFSLFSNPILAKKGSYYPFVLADEKPGVNLATEIKAVQEKLQNGHFSIVGEYSPYKDSYIIIFTSDTLRKIVSKTRYGGFAAALRVSIVKYKQNIQITYTNPVFMQHAYRLRKNTSLEPILEQLKATLGYKKEFGAKKGIKERKLRKYNYTFGMQKFNHFYELPDYSSHKEAIKKVEQGLAEKKYGLSQVYKITIPGKEQVVYGFSMRHIDTNDEYVNDEFIMNIINKPLNPRRDAHLPYEVMVDGKNIYAMHPHFRIAINFSDLKMWGSAGFGKLLGIDDAIYKALSLTVGGQWPPQWLEE